MKKPFFLISLFLFFFAFQSIGQSGGTSILPFEEGKVLTTNDITFLQLISNTGGKPESRGGKPGEAIVSSETYKVDGKLTKAQAETIKKAINEYSKTNEKSVTKTETSPSANARDYCGYCCYYYYWDSYYGCYMYYWYYCCSCY